MTQHLASAYMSVLNCALVAHSVSLWYRTAICITEDKFSLGFYWRQMVGYYVEDTVSHW